MSASTKELIRRLPVIRTRMAPSCLSEVWCRYRMIAKALLCFGLWLNRATGKCQGGYRYCICWKTVQLRKGGSSRYDIGTDNGLTGRVWFDQTHNFSYSRIVCYPSSSTFIWVALAHGDLTPCIITEFIRPNSILGRLKEWKGIDLLTTNATSEMTENLLLTFWSPVRWNGWVPYLNNSIHIHVAYRMCMWRSRWLSHSAAYMRERTRRAEGRLATNTSAEHCCTAYRQGAFRCTTQRIAE